jgi:hypothetical protein
MSDNRTLTLRDGRTLAEVISAVDSGARLEWYPLGTDSADHPLKLVMRAFTYYGGGFYAHDADVREAYIWCSGMFEMWLKVTDVMRALENISGEFGLDQPIARINP